MVFTCGIGHMAFTCGLMWNPAHGIHMWLNVESGRYHVFTCVHYGVINIDLSREVHMCDKHVDYVDVLHTRTRTMK